MTICSLIHSTSCALNPIVCHFLDGTSIIALQALEQTDELLAKQSAGVSQLYMAAIQ